MVSSINKSLTHLKYSVHFNKIKIVFITPEYHKAMSLICNSNFVFTFQEKHKGILKINRPR